MATPLESLALEYRAKGIDLQKESAYLHATVNLCRGAKEEINNSDIPVEVTRFYAKTFLEIIKGDIHSDIQRNTSFKEVLKRDLITSLTDFDFLGFRLQQEDDRVNAALGIIEGYQSRLSQPEGSENLGVDKSYLYQTVSNIGEVYGRAFRRMARSRISLDPIPPHFR